MGRTIQAAERFVRKHNPREEGQPVNWICMDERPALIDGLYRQTGGGAVGVGEDLGVSMILGKRRNDARRAQEMSVSTGMPQAHLLGGVATKIVRPEGIILNTHGKCAAEGAALTIRDAIVNQRDRVFAQTQLVRPMDRDRYDQIADAFDALPIAEATQAARDLDHGVQTLWTPSSAGRPQAVPPVNRVDLVDMPHVASNIIINEGRGVAYDARGAMEANTPAYHVSLGDLVEVHDALYDTIPTDRDDFVDSAVVRHAATSLFLPLQEENTPLNIYRLTA